MMALVTFLTIIASVALSVRGARRLEFAPSPRLAHGIRQRIMAGTPLASHKAHRNAPSRGIRTGTTHR
jgi:hypothetical protein